MRRRGVSSERRHSSHSSLFLFFLNYFKKTICLFLFFSNFPQDNPYPSISDDPTEEKLDDSVLQWEGLELEDCAIDGTFISTIPVKEKRLSVSWETFYLQIQCGSYMFLKRWWNILSPFRYFTMCMIITVDPLLVLSFFSRNNDICIDGLMQERRSSIANALELHLFCTNPLIWYKELNVYIITNYGAIHISNIIFHVTL